MSIISIARTTAAVSFQRLISDENGENFFIKKFTPYPFQKISNPIMKLVFIDKGRGRVYNNLK